MKPFDLKKMSVDHKSPLEMSPYMMTNEKQVNTAISSVWTSDKDTSSSSASSLRRNEKPNDRATNRRRYKTDSRTVSLKMSENNIKITLDKLDKKIENENITRNRNSLNMKKNGSYAIDDVQTVIGSDTTQQNVKPKRPSTTNKLNNNKNQDANVKNSKTNLRKRHSKSLDDLTKASTLNKNERPDTNEVHTASQIEQSVSNSTSTKPIIKQNQIKFVEPMQVNDQPLGMDANKLQKKSKFQVFKQSTSSISNFFVKIFHKSNLSIHIQDQDSNNNDDKHHNQKKKPIGHNNSKHSKQQQQQQDQHRHSSVFNLTNPGLGLNKKSKVISASTNLSSLAMATSINCTITNPNSSQSVRNLDNKKSFEDTVSVNSCVTYVNPFFDGNPKAMSTRQLPVAVLSHHDNHKINVTPAKTSTMTTAQKLEDIINNSSIYSSLDEYDHIVNNSNCKSSSNGSLKDVGRLLCETPAPLPQSQPSGQVECGHNDDLLAKITKRPICTNQTPSTTVTVDHQGNKTVPNNNINNKMYRQSEHFQDSIKIEGNLLKTTADNCFMKSSSRRSLSMSQEKREKLMHKKMDTNQMRKSNEYCEPFDILSASFDRIAACQTGATLKEDLITIEQLTKANMQPHATEEDQPYSSIEFSNLNRNMMSSGYFSSDTRLNEWSEAEAMVTHKTAESVHTIKKPIQIDMSLKCIINSDYETISDLMVPPVNIEPDVAVKGTNNDAKSDVSGSHIDTKSQSSSLMTTFEVLCNRGSSLVQFFDNFAEYSHSASHKALRLVESTTRKQPSQLDIVGKQSTFLSRTLTFTLPNNSTDLFTKIKSHLFDLSYNDNSIFNQNITEFVVCILNTVELSPYVVMGNIRQFMNGIKNYLINESLGEIAKNFNEDSTLINIDLIIEACLQMSILKKLKAKLYYLIVDHLVSDNTLLDLNNTIKTLNGLDEADCLGMLCIKTTKFLPNKQTAMIIRNYYDSLQFEYAPLEKLKFILLILNEVVCLFDENLHLNDLSYLNLYELTPVLIYTIVKCGMNALHVENEFIWGLINKQLLNNETIFCAQLMSSACTVLRSLATADRALGRAHQDFEYLSTGLLNVLLPDEKHEKLKLCTVPVRKSSKTKDICNLIGFKLKLFNSDEYGLFLIDDRSDSERRLKEDDAPLEIRDFELQTKNKRIVFVFKHKNANFLWPRNIFDIENQFLGTLI
jgi:hypothetical protein